MGTNYGHWITTSPKEIGITLKQPNLLFLVNEMRQNFINFQLLVDVKNLEPALTPHVALLNCFTSCVNNCSRWSLNFTSSCELTLFSRNVLTKA